MSDSNMHQENDMIYVGTDRYLQKLWKERYRGYVMNILRRWGDGKMSVRFERID